MRETTQLNNIETEITSLLLQSEFHDFESTEQFFDSNMYIKNNPVSFYKKNDRYWIKIRYTLFVDIDFRFINYAYHGYITSKGEFKSRDCHSIHHLAISMGITDLLNSNEIGLKITGAIQN